MKDNTLCPCCSGKEYATCCLPILTDHALATTAETLMRSRYTAFVKENTDHLLRTWLAAKRPATLNFDDYPVTWLGLVIHDTVLGGKEDNEGQVEFTSTYIENGQLCNLKERSEFLKKDGLWFYDSGVCTVARSKIERNSPCPCGSLKKFKKCCLNL
jgi:SEC-C motif-containing protein